MNPLDAAILGLQTACWRGLRHAPSRHRDAVQHAWAAVVDAARATAAGRDVDARAQLEEALDRAGRDLGWSETMIIVNKRGRLHAGPARRAAE